jgi:thiol-disulfide isomerase/thioredoxin
MKSRCNGADARSYHRAFAMTRARCSLLLLASLALACRESRKSGQVHPVTPDSLLEVIRKPGARAVVVNAWATTCVPCVQELPDLLQVAREHEDDGVRLVLVSFDVDVPAGQVAEFLSGRGVGFDSYLRTGSSGPFIEALAPEWSGAMPATFLYDEHGTLRRLLEGKCDAATFESGIQEVIGGSR